MRLVGMEFAESGAALGSVVNEENAFDCCLSTKPAAHRGSLEGLYAMSGS